MNVPGLEDRIIAHGRAILAGGADVGPFVDVTALESYRAAIATIAPRLPFDSFETLALAKIGAQYMSKLRLSGPRGIARLLIRWKQAASGAWVIAGAEDISTKLSPWSDIAHYRAEHGGQSKG